MHFLDEELTTALLLTTMAVMISISWWVYPRKQRQQRHNDDEPLRVAIVGAGAIGTITGLRMSKSRRIERILLVGRESLRKALQDSNGRITIQDNAKKQQSKETFVSGKDFDVAFWDDKDLKRRLEDFHVIVLAVKTVSTKVVGGRLASMLPSDSKTTIVSFQNGTRNAEWLQECFSQHPKVKIATSVVAFAAEWETNSATFHLNVSGGCTLEHLQESPARQHVEYLVEALNKGKVSSRLCRNIAPMKYAKLVLNLINPINALSGMTVPSMFAQRGYRRVLAEAIRETIGVLKSSGVPGGSSLVVLMFGWVVPFLLLALPDWMFAAMLNGNAIVGYKSSMLQDLERGRRSSNTEIDDLCGEVVRLAESEECVPINMALVRLMATAKKGTCLSPNDLLEQVGLEA